MKKPRSVKPGKLMMVLVKSDMESIKWTILKKDLSDGKHGYTMVTCIQMNQKKKENGTNMTSKKNNPGDIYQIDPKDEHLPGQFVVATEVYSWGVQGYLLLSMPDAGTLCRIKGRAFIRKKWEDIVRVGQVEWEIKETEEQNEPNSK